MEVRSRKYISVLELRKFTYLCFRCFFILDTMAPLFDLTLPMYHQQLKKDLVMNIYRDGKWGSYRHLPLDDCACVTVPHACINIMTRGDLSSLKWMEGNLDPKTYGSAVISHIVERFIHDFLRLYQCGNPSRTYTLAMSLKFAVS
jgi:hypothetical protein